MSRVGVILFVLSIGVSTLLAGRRSDDDFFGLTQSQLAAKVGFPLRVFTLPANARGGPGVLFWVYYQRSPSGKIEDKEFIFQGAPLKVCSTSVDIVPSRFLSLERDFDFQQIFKYNGQHGR